MNVCIIRFISLFMWNKNKKVQNYVDRDKHYVDRDKHYVDRDKHYVDRDEHFVAIIKKIRDSIVLDFEDLEYINTLQKDKIIKILEINNINIERLNNFIEYLNKNKYSNRLWE